MKDKCCSCQTGEAPPKQPDVPIEEIEEDMRRMRSPSGMDDLAKWLDERPLRVQEAARNFPPFQMYLVKEGAPYRFTCAGSIVSPLKFTEDQKTGRVSTWFRVLRSPIGHAGVVAEIDPEYLKPVTLDEVKKMALAQDARRTANLVLAESIIGAITMGCTCPDPCHVHGGHGGVERPEGTCPGCGLPLDPGCTCINCERGGEVPVYGAPIFEPNTEVPDCPKCGRPTNLVAADTFLCTNCDPNQLLPAHPVNFINTHLTEDEIVRCGHDHDPCDEVCPECGCQLWSKEDYDG